MKRQNPWLVWLILLFTGLMSAGLTLIVAKVVLYLFGVTGAYYVFYIIVPVAIGIYMIRRKRPK